MRKLKGKKPYGCQCCRKQFNLSHLPLYMKEVTQVSKHTGECNGSRGTSKMLNLCTLENSHLRNHKSPIMYVGKPLPTGKPVWTTGWKHTNVTCVGHLCRCQTFTCPDEKCNQCVPGLTTYYESDLMRHLNSHWGDTLKQILMWEMFLWEVSQYSPLKGEMSCKQNAHSSLQFICCVPQPVLRSINCLWDCVLSSSVYNCM